MTFLGLNKLGLIDEKIIVSDEDAKLIKLGLQHVNVIIRYHDQTGIRAMTLTSLEKKIPSPENIKPKHDIDEKAPNN